MVMGMATGWVHFYYMGGTPDQVSIWSPLLAHICGHVSATQASSVVDVECLESVCVMLT